MYKTKSTIIFFLVSLVVLLSACGGQRYLSYEETYQKLEEAEYTVIGKTDKDEILDALQELAESYNKFVEHEKSEYNVEYPEMDPNATNVESIIIAEKGDSRAFIFYCEDEESALIINFALFGVYSSKLGEQLGSQDKNFVFLYSVEVNEILKFSKDY